jgi:hypothetical protein
LHDRTEKLPDQIRFERAGSAPDFGAAFGGQNAERNYLKDAHVAYPPGKASIVAYEFRFECCCGSIERYAPLNEAECAKRSESRKAKAAAREDEKWNAEHPLFAGAGK